MNPIFGIDLNFAQNVREEGLSVTFEHAVPRAEFLQQYPAFDGSDVRTLAYEPARNLYHIMNAAYELTVLNSPEEDPRMAFIHNNLADIQTWFDARKVADD